MPGLQCYRDWLSTIPYGSDKVILQNLAVTVKAGVDVWGRERAQPALLSTTVHLRNKFNTAAATDSVDRSTIHYGVLAKEIVPYVTRKDRKDLSISGLATDVWSTVTTIADSPEIIRGTEVRILYPKACMYGDGVEFLACYSEPLRDVAQVLHLKNIKLPCLVGVNKHERLQQQPIIINVWIECIQSHAVDQYGDLEKIIMEVRSLSL
jgi:dihydroneopterin aldolase